MDTLPELDNRLQVIDCLYTESLLVYFRYYLAAVEGQREGSLSCLQQLAAGSHRQPDESNPHTPIIFL
jgi:hypothetical protein